MAFDYGKGPSRADWQKHHELLNAGIKGWNALQRLPKILKEEIPWMKDFEIGFFSESDMAEMISIGWRPLLTKDFGEEGFKNFNEAIGLRFNLSDAAGMVKYRENVLMIMDRDYRKELVKARDQAFEETYKKSVTSRVSSIANDPRADEMESYSSATLDETRFAHDEDLPEGQVTTAKRGRPRKT